MTRIFCPHCITPCQVAEQHLGMPVRCHKCGETFTAKSVAHGDLPSTEPIPVTAGVLRLGIAGVTSTGKQRSRNEDSFLVQHLTWWENENYQLALIIVADGVGGHAAGDVAAGLVIRTVGKALAPILSGALSGQFNDVTRKGLAASIEAALKDANQAVQKQAGSNRRFKGMAATAAVAVIWNGRVVIGHIGDCRVYHFHAGKFPGDWLLVACDGLHSQLTDQLIQATMKKAPPSAYLLTSRLVDLANESGGADNCTVVSVRCY